jgi:L-fuconolactonase
VTPVWDSHCHAWERWPYSPAVPDPFSRGSVEQLLMEMDGNGVERALIVCASIGNNPGNVAYADSVRSRHPDRLSVLADLDCSWHETYHRPGAAERLRTLSSRYELVGVTHYMTSDNDGWLRSGHCDELLEVARERGLLVSLSLDAAWYGDLHDVALRHPEVPLLVHHLGQTRRAAGDGTPPAGLDVLLSCAGAPNVYVKVSGFYYHVQPVRDLQSEYPWPEARQVLRSLYDAFGAARLVWGSDYPVARPFCTYRQSLDIVRRHCDFLSGEEQAAILGKNLEGLLRARSPANTALASSLLLNDELLRRHADRQHAG